LVRIGHNLSEEQIFERVGKYWSLDGFFPLPKFHVKCPVCGAGDSEIIIREMTFTVRSGSPRPFRCNVSFKCTRCSYSWVHGVVIPKEMASKHGLPHASAKSYTWREICKKLQAPYGISVEKLLKRG